MNSPRMAIDFIRALLAEGHQVSQVFFYHDGVRAGFGDSASDWVKVAQGGEFDLVLCSQALDQRGLAPHFDHPFVVGGLGLWVDACLKADRVIRFGAPSHAD